MENWIIVGKILRPHGIHGALKYLLFNESSDCLQVGLKVQVSLPKTSDKELTIGELFGDNRLFFDEIDDRNQAEGLREAQLSVRRNDLPEIDTDEIYLADLIGFSVVTKSGDLLGTINGFSENGAQPLMIIETAKGKKELVPFVKPLVKEVLEEDKKVIVDLPEGLIEAS